MSYFYFGKTFFQLLFKTDVRTKAEKMFIEGLFLQKILYIQQVRQTARQYAVRPHPTSDLLTHRIMKWYQILHFIPISWFHSFTFFSTQRTQRKQSFFCGKTRKTLFPLCPLCWKKSKLMKSTYGYKMENLVSSHFTRSQDV